MQNTYLEELTHVLQKDERLVNADGRLLKTKIGEYARQLDDELIKLLLANMKLKAFFFKDIDGTLVFDLNKFLNFVHNEAFLADSYTVFKNKIGLATSKDNYLNETGDVVLNWPYKDCVLEGGQDKEDQKRDEVFWNETLGADQRDVLLAPKTLADFKRYDRDGEHAVAKIYEEDNLVIRGNNLLALHTLKKRYAGKVKLIYIDPPFNTGNDSFGYNDHFSSSTWLTFMKNRLEIAKDLLSEDGNIFVHLDDNESHYAKVLLDQIFGRDNFVEEIVWSYGTASGGRAAGAKPVSIHDYILHYAKSYSKRTQNKLFTAYSDKYIKDWFKYTENDGRRYRRRMRARDIDGNAAWDKQYLDESNGIPLTTVWSDIKQVYADPRAYKAGMEHTTEIVKGFSGQKPEALLKRIFEMCTNENDLILDYHLGTGTTIVAAHKMARRYIGVEQLHYGKNDAVNRLQKVISGDKSGISTSVDWQGGGSFVYAHLKNDANAFIKEIEKAKSKSEVEGLLQTVLASNFLSHRVDPTAFEKESFGKLTLDSQKHLLIDLVNKNKLYVNFHDIDDESYGIDENTKKLNRWIQSRS